MTHAPTGTLAGFTQPLIRLPIVEQINRQVAEPILQAARRPVIDPNILTRTRGIVRDFQRTAESILPKIRPALLEAAQAERTLNLFRAQAAVTMRPILDQVVTVQLPDGWLTRPLRRPQLPTPAGDELGIGRYDLVRGSSCAVPRPIQAMTDYAMDADQLRALLYALALTILWAYGPEGAHWFVLMMANNLAWNRVSPILKAIGFHRRNGN